MNDELEADALAHLVLCSCGAIAANADIRAITVIGRRRLTFRELIRVRSCAEPCGVGIAMDGRGTVTVRRLGAAACAQSVESWRRD